MMYFKYLFVLLLALQSSIAYSQEVAKPVDLNVEEFASAIQKTPGTILDVRTPEEVERGKLNTAVVIDFYDDDFRKKLKQLDKTKPVYVYCAAGGRSADAAIMLTELGFKKVYNLEGGFRAWKAAGKPVVTP